MPANAQPLLTQKMSTMEWRAALSLASIISLRMLGLFMVLPVFTLYATPLKGATPVLIGLAMGIYGLTQGLFQIPLGALSDHFGRRKIITAGLLVFISGCILSAVADSIGLMIVGRALQGVGAVGSTLIALAADLTREEHRTKTMAVIGITIGFSFTFAMALGPLFSTWINIFWLAAAFGGFAIVLLYYWVPRPLYPFEQPEIVTATRLIDFLKMPELMRLNFGIFALHVVLTATFVVLPISLQNKAGLASHGQWLLYLPTLLTAFLLSLPIIIVAEKKHYLKPVFLGCVLLLAGAECLMWVFADKLLLFAVSLLLFFTAFSSLEAFLPSLVSRNAPASRKGTALGIYSCSQFLGIFVGGTLGGWLYGALSLTTVYLFCVGAAAIWFVIALGMKKPQHSRNTVAAEPRSPSSAM